MCRYLGFKGNKLPSIRESRNLLVTAHSANPHLPGPTRDQLAFAMGSGQAQLAAFYNRGGAAAVEASRQAQDKMMVSGLGFRQ